MSDIDLVKKLRVYAEEAEKNGFEVLTVPLRDLFPLLGRMEAAERELDDLRAEIARRDAAASEPVMYQIAAKLPGFWKECGKKTYDEYREYHRYLGKGEHFAPVRALYTAAPPAVLPPDITFESKGFRSLTSEDIAYNLALMKSRDLGAQEHKGVQFDNVFSIIVAGVSVPVILLKDVSTSLDAANVKWEVKK